MRKKIRCIGFYFSALISLVMLGGCVSTGPVYYPKSLETSPVTKIVKVIIPETEKIKMVDGESVSSTTTLYVSPGKHTYTFKIDYRSPTYCNGPSYGLKATKDFLLEDGEVSSVVTMDGNFSMDVSASEGQTVQFVFKPEPDCKSRLDDYFKVVKK
jgi:hypothetical protein